MPPRFVLSLLSLLVVSGACKKDAPPAAAPPPTAAVVAPPTPAPVDGRLVELSVTDDGFVPANVTLKANQKVTFRVTRKTDETCARDLLIDGTDIKLALPLNEAVETSWTPTKAGEVKFGCAMDKMIGGVLLVE
jgi:hypothetical protein